MMEAYERAEGEKKTNIKQRRDLLVEKLKFYAAGNERLQEILLLSINKLDMGKPYIFNHYKWLREKLELEERPKPPN
jgi:hypothetical protein